MNTNSPPTLNKQDLIEEQVVYKEVSNAFLSNEVMFQCLAEAVQDAIILTDGDGKIIFLNKVARAIYGYQETEIIGKSVATLIPKQHLHDYKKGYKSVQTSMSQGNVGQRIQTSGMKKDGTEFPVEISISTCNSNGGRYHYLTVRDMSEIKEVQQRALLQDRLAAVGQLAAGIAHDFNNLLVPITLYSEILLNDPDVKPKAQKHLNTILSQAKRAATLTQQFLDFSRKGIIEPKPLNLLDFLIELIELLKRTLPENIQLSLASGSHEYIVNADPVRMQQVFLNLALNARDALPKGGELQFELACLRVEEDKPPFRDMSPGLWVRIKVIDDGEGIHPNHLSHIFEPFFTTKPPSEGTGLGLSQVYGIIKQHGGYIDVRSMWGSGTEFIIYLPVLSENNQYRPNGEGNYKNAGGGETILLVEDDLSVQHALHDILTAVNYNVLVADNGQDAMTIFHHRGEEIDLIISDIVMPKMGGTALLRSLQEIKPAVKMVLISGYPLGDEPKKLLDNGQLTWIQKPVDTRTLIHTIRKALNGE